ncbi:gibberellin-regulated protein 14-like [Nicotiana sylvestris]|uniref:gibberellin-regulated protein 14-like n=1 Tax=Nicotiana sylvestris TaxID=4096 RepID=UPI00388C8D22
MSGSDKSVEEEKMEMQMMKEEMDRLRQEIAGIHLAWVKGQTPPILPPTPTLSPVRTPEHPSTGPSASFPITQYYRGGGETSYNPQASPSKQNPTPPTVPIFVAPPPATLQKSPDEPVFQVQDNQYYPPELTFKAPEPYTYTPPLQFPT